MANLFEKLMERKKKERYLNRHQQQIGRVGSMLAQPYQDISKQIEYGLERGGAPLATKFDTALQQQQQLAGMLGQQYEGAVTRDIERKGRLTEQISELEFKSDILKEQKKKEEEAKEQKWWQVGAQVGGAVLGGIAGSIIPGVDPLTGAQLGSAVGGGVAGAFTDSPEMLLQATGDVLSVIGTESGLKTVEAKTQQYNEAMNDITLQYRNNQISSLEAFAMLEDLKFKMNSNLPFDKFQYREED